MELERGHIQKRDFPQDRKGYDADAVDSHLRAIADAVDQLKSAQAAAPASLAGAAASSVEAIVAAAEASAREIEQKAHADADEIRTRAESDAAEHVTRAREMVELLAGGAEQLQGEIDDVVVRVNGLKAALDAVRVDLVAAESDVAPPSPATSAV